MEFLNNTQNRDIKKIIDNYINNANFKFNDGEISLTYYISPNSKIDIKIFIVFYTIAVETIEKGNRFLSLENFSNYDGAGDYRLDLEIGKENILLEYIPYRRTEGISGCISLTIDYSANKEEIDKFISYIDENEMDQLDEIDA